MKQIRRGNYCQYLNGEYELVVDSVNCKVVHRDSINFDVPDGFQKYKNETYVLDIKCSEISSAFYVETFCLFKGFVFFVERLLENNKFRILPLEEAQKNLSITSKHGIDPVFEVSENEIKEIWEERTPIEGFKFIVDHKEYLKK